MVILSVVRDYEMYRRCILNNLLLDGCEKVCLDNSTDNRAIPTRYNAYLDGLGDKDDWLMFCHEDFEPRENPAPVLAKLDRNSIYGPIGSKRVGAFGLGMQKILGSITECNRDGSGTPWTVGKRVNTGTRVETLDCCCLIVHSSLVKKFRLRFDEQLFFDLYVEDFCAAAKTQHGIVSRIVQMKAIHHSGSRATERLFRHLPYLENKYSHDCFSATCVYFGKRSLLMRFEDDLLRIASLRRLSRFTTQIGI